jgi:hypothetical protein
MGKSIRVTVTAEDRDVAVTSQKIVDDGRERHDNGVDIVRAGTSDEFLVHSGQSIRIDEHIEPPAQEVDEDESAENVEGKPAADAPAVKTEGGAE